MLPCKLIIIGSPTRGGVVRHIKRSATARKSLLVLGDADLFGSDAHNVYEIRDFALHIDFLRRCGFDGELSDVIVDPREEVK